MTIEQRPSLSIALPKSYLFTSESVTEGHPDKMCDQISDAILDAIISKEIELEREGYIAPSGQPADVSRMRCACETLATTGLVAVAGEIRTQAYVDVPAIVREVVCGIGYDRAKYGFDGTTCGVVNAIHEQSPDIAQGVDESWEAAHGGAEMCIRDRGEGERRVRHQRRRARGAGCRGGGEEPQAVRVARRPQAARGARCVRTGRARFAVPGHRLVHRRFQRLPCLLYTSHMSISATRMPTGRYLHFG